MGVDLGTVGAGISGGARGRVPRGGGVVAPLAEPPGPAVGATTAVRRGALERGRTAVLVAIFRHVPFPQKRAVSCARPFALPGRGPGLASSRCALGSLLLHSVVDITIVGRAIVGRAIVGRAIVGRAMMAGLAPYSCPARRGGSCSSIVGRAIVGRAIVGRAIGLVAPLPRPNASPCCTNAVECCRANY